MNANQLQRPIMDRRGRTRHTKITPSQIHYMHTHIESFPKIESHYCRSSTKKLYLEGSLNVTIMHNCYLVSCNEDNEQPVKLSYYRNYFNTKFNIAFNTRAVKSTLKCKSTKSERRLRLGYDVIKKMGGKYNLAIVDR